MCQCSKTLYETRLQKAPGGHLVIQLMQSALAGKCMFAHCGQLVFIAEILSSRKADNWEVNM